MRGTPLALRRAMKEKIRLRRARRRAFTLMEIMVVIVIIGLISGATAVAVFHHAADAKIKTSRIAARTIRSAAAMYRMEHDADECPTTKVLRDAELLDRAQNINDAWGTPYSIVCEASAVIVVSAGPDRQPQTPDDLREPPPT
jgi:general secretion pathway protein G